MIGRLSLTWLWPIFLLMALPSAHARVIRSADGIPVALVSSADSGNHRAHDFERIHYRSALRSARRFVFPSAPDDDSSALRLSQVEVTRGENASCSHRESHPDLGLASTWQFLWRTALSPRAPSFVS
jgi:hypothetical protein